MSEFGVILTVFNLELSIQKPKIIRFLKRLYFHWVSISEERTLINGFLISTITHNLSFEKLSRMYQEHPGRLRVRESSCSGCVVPFTFSHGVCSMTWAVVGLSLLLLYLPAQPILN